MGQIFTSRRARRAGAITLSIATAAALAPAAVAATIGAGDQYHIGNAGTDPVGMCTVNSVQEGADGTRYALTAGHCADGVPGLVEGEDVVASDPKTGEQYGTFVHATYDDDLVDLHDYALIELDDSVEVREGVTSTASLGTALGVPEEWATSPVAPMTRIGTAEQGDIVYKDGSTSGRTPGVVLYTDNEYTVVLTAGLPGDSGGVLHDGKGTNLGITSQSMIFLPIAIWQRSDRATENLADEGYDLQVEVEPFTGETHTYIEDAYEWAEDFDRRHGIEPSNPGEAPVTEALVNTDQQIGQAVSQANEFQRDPQQAVQQEIAAVEQQVQSDVSAVEQQVADASAQFTNDVNAGVQQFADQAGVQIPQF